MNPHYGIARAAKLNKDGAEITPGPGIIRNCAIHKVVQATHHQRKEKYGEYTGYAGKPCTSNAYLALIFLAIKNICICKAVDLGNILEQGYELLLN